MNDILKQVEEFSSNTYEEVLDDITSFVNILDMPKEVESNDDNTLSMVFTNPDTKELECIIDFQGNGNLKMINEKIEINNKIPTQRRLMIDIETTSLSTDAAVWEIGYWEIGSDFNDVNGEDYYNGSFLLNPYDQMRLVDEDTLSWLEQNCDKWDEIKNQFDDLEPTKTLLEKFQMSFIDQGFDEVWCKGSDFDFAILRSLFRDSDLALPWHYRKQCCMRSLLNVYPEFVQEYTQGQAHTGMYDARSQAVCVENILQHLGRY